jgi:hypothetical protein
VGEATLVNENDRFFSTSGDPYMGHMLRLLFTLLSEKGHKGLFLR